MYNIKFYCKQCSICSTFFSEVYVLLNKTREISVNFFQNPKESMYNYTNWKRLDKVPTHCTVVNLLMFFKVIFEVTKFIKLQTKQSTEIQTV